MYPILSCVMHCYFVGNDAIHAITSRGNYTLTIRLTNWDNITKFANYSMFRIANESDGYRLNIKGYSGEAGNYIWLFYRTYVTLIKK